MASRQRLVFGPLDRTSQFKCLKRFRFNGRQFVPGELFDPSLTSERRLRQLRNARLRH